MDGIVQGLKKVCKFQYVHDKDGNHIGSYLTLYSLRKMDAVIDVLYEQDLQPLFSGNFSMQTSSSSNRNHNRKLLQPLYEKFVIMEELKTCGATPKRKKI